MEQRLPISVPQDELANFNQFWQSLSEADQRSLNELLDSAAHNQAAIKYSGYDLPYHAFLISLLIEQHKDLIRLRRLLEEARAKKSLEE
jgi:hypothetical protein